MNFSDELKLKEVLSKIEQNKKNVFEYSLNPSNSLKSNNYIKFAINIVPILNNTNVTIHEKQIDSLGEIRDGKNICK